MQYGLDKTSELFFRNFEGQTSLDLAQKSLVKSIFEASEVWLVLN